MSGMKPGLIVNVGSFGGLSCLNGTSSRADGDRFLFWEDHGWGTDLRKFPGPIRITGGYIVDVAYGIGKAAMDRMAADMAIELETKSITMVSVWPGLVQTEKLGDH